MLFDNINYFPYISELLLNFLLDLVGEWRGEHTSFWSKTFIVL